MNKEESITASYENSAREWRQLARRAVMYCARTFETFTTEKVWIVLDEAGHERPPEPRALGGVMRRVRREGFIEATGGVVCGSMRHGAPLREWRRCE